MFDYVESSNAQSDGMQRRRLPVWGLLLIEAGLLLSMLFGLKLWIQHQAMGPAPMFVANNIQGEPVALEQYLSEAEGPVLLYFWAEWCSNCKRAEDMMNRLAENDRVLTVAVQSGDAPALAEYLAANELTMPTIADPDGVLMSRYQVEGVPATFIIDREGEIRFRLLGLFTEWGLRFRWWAAEWFSIEAGFKNRH